MGDRSSFDALISSWLPQAREEFELRRKQAAFKALSQIKGVSVATQLATVLLHPSGPDGDGDRIDVVWLIGLLGLTRLRPGARVRLATRRQVGAGGSGNGGRAPRTLAGESVEGLDGLRLDDFCHAPPAELEVRRVGDTVHYLFGGDAFGKKAVSDLLLAEVNLAEMAREPEPGRRGYVFAEVGTPGRRLLFDVLVHRDVYPGATPSLEVYDTAFDGVVDANDPARTVDRLDLTERLDGLGDGLDGLRTVALPNYRGLLEHVFGSLGWDAAEFRAHRCEIDYPLYGSQVVAAFGPPG